MENSLKQEKTKKDLEKKLFFSPAQKTIDFRYSQNNILDNDRFKNIKKLKNSYTNRLNFEKDLKEKTKRSIAEKRLNNFRTMIYYSNILFKNLIFLFFFFFIFIFNFI
jgi:hypothetical protein